ncbi:MAG: hypothetical protein QOF87_4791 [Pseudonocardiales bacterium]|jgi:pyruvate dehydrogenase E2 component (dihydrolipoamide acetyltransferase)|nr:pyruvate dehydrogenase complex dihydrolipoamide acetyltransferase [Pseudonocardiales bacterium]MDT4965144.1 hypothetical protein [Pseudonocardiales bacterium]
MSVIVRMPEVLTGMAEAILIEWHVAPGDAVVVGQPLVEVETEKATVEYQAEVAGTLAQYLVELGTPIPVGEPIAMLAEAGEPLDEARSPSPAAPTETGDATSTAARTEVAADASAETDPSIAPDQSDAPKRQFISPLVRRMAREQNIDASQVRGSGPNGRIVRRDIERIQSRGSQDVVGVGDASAIPRPPQIVQPVAGVELPDAASLPAAETVRHPTVPAPTAAGPAMVAAASDVTEIPHTAMRRAIARRLTESKATVPHFYLVADCRVDALLELRRAINEQMDAKVSVNDFVVKAVAGAFQDVPEANAVWTPEATRRFRSVDIAVAVAIDGGLLTPVVREVERRSLSELNGVIADLVDRARHGRLKQPELEGAVLAVSNLGMYGIERFGAIINPPHAGILAVGAATQRPVVEDGQLAVATVMTVTLSGDHRVLDGALAARWLSAFVARVENPLRILI